MSKKRVGVRLKRVAPLFLESITKCKLLKVRMKKTHHNPDYEKNKTADVIKKGSGRAVPNEHWEVNRNLTPEGSDTAAGAFLPRSGKNRPCTHVRTNECDH